MYSIYYKFNYNGHEEDYSYEISFDQFMNAIRTYFDNQLITLDGKDNDVYNALLDLDCLDNIFDAMEDWLYDHCKESAYEAYKEYIDWYYEDED